MNKKIEVLKALSWQGYLRADGRKGIRNKVLLVYTVECSHHVARKVADHFDEQVELVGFGGCTDNAYAVKMLLALSTHPNVGAVLAIGLGCEYVQPQRIASYAEESGRMATGFYIQDEGGTQKSIDKGIGIVSSYIEALKKTERVEMGFEDLLVGCECGGSDYTSGLAGNVVVGKFFDVLVDLGGTAIFEEIVEAIGLRSILLERAENEGVRKQLDFAYEKAMVYCKKVKQYSISPGNFVGGLSTIEEKSMGAIIKSGSQPIRGVLKVSECPKGKGLYLIDSVPDHYFMEFGITNPNDNEGLMDLIAGGCQLVLLVTGRGNVVGSAVAPVLKITGNKETFNKLSEDMDYCVWSLLSGEATLSELALALAHQIARVSDGEKTNAEKLGHCEYFVPYKYQNDIKRC